MDDSKIYDLTHLSESDPEHRRLRSIDEAKYVILNPGKPGYGDICFYDGVESVTLAVFLIVTAHLTTESERVIMSLTYGHLKSRADFEIADG